MWKEDNVHNHLRTYYNSCLHLTYLFSFKINNPVWYDYLWASSDDIRIIYSTITKSTVFIVNIHVVRFFSFCFNIVCSIHLYRDCDFFILLIFRIVKCVFYVFGGSLLLDPVYDIMEARNQHCNCAFFFSILLRILKFWLVLARADALCLSIRNHNHEEEKKFTMFFLSR